jgi:sulfur-oxidizing protein SoxY
MRRRTLLALPLTPLPLIPLPAQAEGFAAEEAAILAGRTPLTAGIAIEMPVLSENGNSVDIAVRVESPNTRDDHVTAIHILSEKNPVPRVASFTLGPRSGRAEVATRIRLATTQTILVLAETSRGQVHRAAREVIVILGACVDGG